MNKNKTLMMNVTVVKSNGNETGEVKQLEVNVEDVRSTYTGKPGCMCGCNGTYKYNPHHQESESKRRGYEVTEDELSERSVKRMMSKFEKLGTQVKTYERNPRTLFFDTDSRTNVMFLTVK